MHVSIAGFLPSAVGHVGFLGRYQFHPAEGVDDMTNCDFLNTSHRDTRAHDRLGEPDGAGEREYREHVTTHRLSIGEIVVVVVAVVLLAGMGLFNQDNSALPRTASATFQTEHLQRTSLLHCDDDDSYLEQVCQP
jgi:hypothetical protein